MTGHLFQITQFVEQRKTPFSVSRLIMMTGVKLRQFTATTPDDEAALQKVRQALPSVLVEAEIRELEAVLLGVGR